MKIAVIFSLDKKVRKVGAHKLDCVRWDSEQIKNLNLRDYDGVIIDAASVSEDVYVASEGRLNIFQSLVEPSVVEDILFGPNSFVFLIGSPNTKLFNTSVAEAMGINFEMIDGSGDSIFYLDEYETSVYKEYLGRLTRYSYSYKSVTLSAKYNSYYIEEEELVCTRAGNTISSVAKLEERGTHWSLEGKLGFFPALESMQPSEYIHLLLKCHFSEDGNISQEPDWAQAIEVEGQKGLVASIKKTKEQIGKLQDSLKESQGELSVMRKDVEIVYKNGKPLEESIKEALKSIGISIYEPEDTANVEFRIEDEKYKFVVEVKSTQKQHIDKKSLRQVIDWQNDAYDDTGKDYKALVIASSKFDISIEQRDEDILPDDLKKYAKKKDICVINVISLFRFIQGVKSKTTTKEQFLEKLDGINGLAVYSKK